jgi:hypothetical protein
MFHTTARNRPFLFIITECSLTKEYVITEFHCVFARSIGSWLESSFIEYRSGFIQRLLMVLSFLKGRKMKCDLFFRVNAGDRMTSRWWTERERKRERERGKSSRSLDFRFSQQKTFFKGRKNPPFKIRKRWSFFTSTPNVDRFTSH